MNFFFIISKTSFFGLLGPPDPLGLFSKIGLRHFSRFDSRTSCKKFKKTWRAISYILRRERMNERIRIHRTPSLTWVFKDWEDGTIYPLTFNWPKQYNINDNSLNEILWKIRSVFQAYKLRSNEYYPPQMNNFHIH